MQTQSPRQQRVVLSEINVTPFVDVMLVLLIIFMVTAPLMQQGIEIELPETAASGVEAKEEPFVLAINKNEKIMVGKTAVDIEKLSDKLRAIFKTRKNKQIYIQADKSVSYGYVAQTLAEIRAAGIFNIGLVTIPKNSL